MINRRDFIKLALLGAGTMGCFPHISPESDRARSQPKEVWAWLRMFDIDGTYDIPSSEATYLANLRNIDVAMPTNGGTLQSDGSWLQEPWKINPDWPQSLPEIARSAGHRYIPIVNNDRQGYLAVLDDPALQSVAADNLVDLATTGRFDSPWDGILLDFESTPTAYRQKLIDFYYLLFDRLEPTGLPVGISVSGRTIDSGTHDFTVIAELADFVDLRCYGYTSPPPKSIGPYWWLEGCIQFALASGIDPNILYLGVGNFSKYWPDSTQYDFTEVTYLAAQQILADANAVPQWIETNQNGVIREWYAQIGAGHIWIHDASTYEYGLNLISQYRIGGLSHFAAGMGDVEHWNKIRHWRNSRLNKPGWSLI